MRKMLLSAIQFPNVADAMSQTQHPPDYQKHHKLLTQHTHTVKMRVNLIKKDNLLHARPPFPLPTSTSQTKGAVSSFGN